MFSISRFLNNTNTCVTGSEAGRREGKKILKHFQLVSETGFSDGENARGMEDGNQGSFLHPLPIHYIKLFVRS